MRVILRTPLLVLAMGTVHVGPAPATAQTTYSFGVESLAQTIQYPVALLVTFRSDPGPGRAFGVGYGAHFMPGAVLFGLGVGAADVSAVWRFEDDGVAFLPRLGLGAVAVLGLGVDEGTVRGMVDVGAGIEFGRGATRPRLDLGLHFFEVGGPAVTIGASVSLVRGLPTSSEEGS